MGVDMFSLEGKVALVTGSGRHIGKAIALGLAECGADIISVARTEAEIEQTASEAKAMGRKAIAIAANVRESEAVKAMVEKAVQEFGRIDILVNNVGATFGHNILEVSEKAWDALIGVNLRPTFLCTQIVGKVMKEKGTKGCIINISSIAGYAASPNGPAYGAAKAAVDHLTKTCAADLGQYGIRVNSIIPGLIEHDGNIEIFGLDKPEIKEQMVKAVPLGRMGMVDDIAGPAVFLASEAASYVSGATLLVSGGRFTN
ncbi:SDR family NAD(P)-dependent oxidoreductase [Chloroflexota bacterium]